MPDISTAMIVYQRRKLQKNYTPVISNQASDNIRSSDHCVSAVTSDISAVAARGSCSGSRVGYELETNKIVIAPTVVCNLDPILSKSESIDGCSVGDLHESDEALKDKLFKNNEFRGLKDSCSSSKSNMEHGSASMNMQVPDLGECSSSGVSAFEDPKEDLSAREFCISILRREGLLEWSSPVEAAHVSSGEVGVSGNDDDSRLCKVCSHSELARNILICDRCEEGYHLSCCTPRIKKVPAGEWSCSSCLKKHKMLRDDKTTWEQLSPDSDLENQKIASYSKELSDIVLVLEDLEPYITGVRIGTAYQANVPDWTGPIRSEGADCFYEPLEVGPAEGVSLDSSTKPCRLSSIGNWLQCRQIVQGVAEGVDGLVCGKWRRAPLFEVQTYNWDCFSSVLWDPTHADCSVPQELETDQVLKQLKYIEMLRPRLAAKRRKLSSLEANCSQDAKNDRDP